MNRLLRIWLRLPHSEGIPSGDYDWFISHARLLSREQMLKVRESDTMDHFKQQVEQEILLRSALRLDSWSLGPLLWISLATLVFSAISAWPVITGALSGKKALPAQIQSPSQSSVIPVPTPVPEAAPPEWHPIIRGGGNAKP